MPDLPSGFDGASLLKLARGKRETPAEIVVESGHQRAYIAPPWKLIWYKNGRPSELFHLERDPLEVHDRAEEEEHLANEMAGKLERWIAHQLDGNRTDPIYATGGSWTCYLDKEED
jgi:hypothetical protein